jgi:hypothetical protein
MKVAVIRDLFWGNAMLEEGRRTWRRWVSGGSVLRRTIRYGTLAVAICLFLFWMLTLANDEGDHALEIEFLALSAITIAIPLWTYGAFAGERERATWEMLVLTRLTSGQILVGKLAWRLLIIATILAAAWLPAALTSEYPQSNPLSSSTGRANLVYSLIGWETLGFITGDMDLTHIICAHVMILSWGLVLCAFSLLVSAHAARSVTAAGAIFGSMLVGMVLMPVVLAMFAPHNSAEDAVFDVLRLSNSVNPFIVLGKLQNDDSYRNPQTIWVDTQAGWYATAAYGGMMAICLPLTYRRLKRMRMAT